MLIQTSLCLFTFYCLFRDWKKSEKHQSIKKYFNDVQVCQEVLPGCPGIKYQEVLQRWPGKKSNYK